MAMMTETLSGITIDAPTSKDLDDALWLEPLPGNRRRVIVFVTDITELVPVDSIVDRQAFEKGATEYKGKFASNRMLPAAIEVRGSLLPDQTRSALAVELDFDALLRLENYTLRRVKFHSLGRYSYRQAAAMALETNPDVIAGWTDANRIFVLVAEIALQLAAERKRRGALSLFQPDEGWEINEDLQIVRLDASQRNVGYLIIQEFAILANHLISDFALRNGIPFVFRNHRITFGENFDAADEGFRQMLVAEVRRFFSKSGGVAAANAKFLGGALKPLRSGMTFERARYEAENSGHMGLAISAYAHNTSPLRRYADLINLRQITAHLSGSTLPYDREKLDSIAAHLTNSMHARSRRVQERLRGIRHRVRETRFELVAENPAAAQVFKNKLTELPEGEFYKMTDIWLDKKNTAGGEDGSRAFLEAIRVKIENDTLPLKVAARILTFGIVDSPRLWRAGAADKDIRLLKREVLSWLATNPANAVSLWTMLPDILPHSGWTDAPEYHFSAAAHLKDFTCEANIKSAEEPTGVLKATGASAQKRQSKALAALNLWILLNGFEPGDFDPPTSAPASGPAAVRSAAPAIDYADVFRALSPMIGAGSYKSALYEFAAQLKSEPPAFRLIFSRNYGKNVFFEAEACLPPFAHIADTTCATGIGANKKQAENQAAKAVCRQLVERLGGATALGVQIPQDDEAQNEKLRAAAAPVKSVLLPAVDQLNYAVAVESYFRRLNLPAPALFVKEITGEAAQSWLVRLTAAPSGGGEEILECVNSSQKVARRECYRLLYEKLAESVAGGKNAVGATSN